MHVHNCDTLLLSQLVRRTPAHLAAKNGHLNVLKVLYQHGADLLLRDEVSVNCISTITSEMQACGGKPERVSCVHFCGLKLRNDVYKERILSEWLFLQLQC